MQGSIKMKALTIMFIDDNEVDNFVNSQLIENAGLSGHQIIMQSSLDAIDYLRQKDLKEEEIPDLILLDIHMPEMDGFEFLDEYEKLPPYITSKAKIFMLSSSLDSIDLEKARSNRYVIKTLAKPLEVEEISRYVRSLSV